MHILSSTISLPLKFEHNQLSGNDLNMHCHWQGTCKQNFNYLFDKCIFNPKTLMNFYLNNPYFCKVWPWNHFIIALSSAIKVHTKHVWCIFLSIAFKQLLYYKFLLALTQSSAVHVIFDILLKLDLNVVWMLIVLHRWKNVSIYYTCILHGKTSPPFYFLNIYYVRKVL